MMTRVVHTFLRQNPCDLVGTMPVAGQIIDPAYNHRGFIVDQPMTFLLRVFPVTIDTAVVGGQTGMSLLLIGCGHFAGLVAQVPFVHHVQDRDKLAAFGIDVVYAIGYGDESHIEFAEHDLGVEAGLQIVPADAAHVFGNHCANLASLNVCD